MRTQNTSPRFQADGVPNPNGQPSHEPFEVLGTVKTWRLADGSTEQWDGDTKVYPQP